jgi:hypothetical protein
MARGGDLVKGTHGDNGLQVDEWSGLHAPKSAHGGLMNRIENEAADQMARPPAMSITPPVT